MKNLVISRQSLGCAIARGLAIVFGMTAVRTLATVLGYMYRVTRNGSLDLLSPDYFVPEAVEFIGSGVFAMWLWSRAQTFLPAVDVDEEDEEQVSIAPGLITHGLMLALAVYLFVPAATHLVVDYLTVPKSFRYGGELDLFVDVGLAFILLASAFVAKKRAFRSVAEATSANTDPRQPQPEPSAVQIREDFAPPAR